jgi:ectoine hydroxylase-related dioxygenase (phytanoyl-CoA dioxygenase family)
MTVASPASAALSPAELRFYNEQGYVILRGVFSGEEVAEAIAEAEALLFFRKDLLATENIRCRWQPHVVTEECLFETFDPVIDIAPVCGRLARDPRILGALGCIYGEPAHLFKDKLIYKPPGAKGYDMHQDYISWPSFPHSFITVEIALDPADADNGCTEVFPGYHLQGYLSPMDGDYHSIPEGTLDESRRVPLALRPGDVAIFGCLTPHCSAPNRSTDRWRRQLYLSYNADSDGGDQRDAHYREFHVWLKQKYAEYGKHNTYFR